MSFKGFTKAVSRAPQSFRQKFNMGEQVEDPVYEDAERRFKELEAEVTKLGDESKRYSVAVNGMLGHQIGFAKAMEEIFKPISGKMSDPNATIPEDNPEGIEACEQYRAIVAELQEVLKPDLKLIDEKVMQPCADLLKTIGCIRKMATKRNHKKLDLDRRYNNFKRHEKKDNPNPKDEERMFKAQAEMEAAQQEYDYYNEMLKVQLPVLFGLEAQFVQPLFVSFYFMQLNIFYTLYNRFQEMKIPYFDLSTDILEAFQFKRGNVEEQCDALTITHFKLGYSKAKLDMTRKRYGSQSPSSAADTPLSGYPGSPASPTAYGAAPVAGAYGAEPGFAPGAAPGAVPGAYGAAPAAGAYGAAPAAGAYAAAPAAAAYGAFGAQSPTSPTMPGYKQSPAPTGSYPAQTAPPPAYSMSNAPSAPPAADTVTALYDYQAQAPGDLSFTAGAVIEVVQRTSDPNEWWTGRYNGQQGVFPGNYVQVNKN